MKINNPNTEIKIQLELQIQQLSEESRVIYVKKANLLKDSLKTFVEKEFFEREVEKVVIDNRFIRVEFLANSLCKNCEITYDRNWNYDTREELFTNPKIEWGRNTGEYLDYCIEVGELSKLVKNKQDKLDIFKAYLIEFDQIGQDPIIQSISDKIQTKKAELNRIEANQKHGLEQKIFNQGYIESFNGNSITFKFSGDSMNQGRSYRRSHQNWSNGNKFTFTKNPGKKTYTVTCFYKSVYYNNEDEKIEEIRSNIVKDNVREEYVWDSIRHYIYCKETYEKKQQAEAMEN
jgi:hypothetical protein